MNRLVLLALLGEEDGVDVGEDTAAGNGDIAEELVELLIVAHGELDVARDDAGLLVVAGSVAGELEDLSAEVLEDGRHVDGGAASDTGGVATLLQVACDTADRELKSRLCRARRALALLLSASSLSFSRHVDVCVGVCWVCVCVFVGWLLLCLLLSSAVGRIAVAAVSKIGGGGRKKQKK